MSPFNSLVVLLVGICCVGAQQLGCDTSNGWIHLGSDKCYKIYHGNDQRTYQRAADVCKCYGSRLAIIKDQYENDMLGTRVTQVAGDDVEYYIGLSEVKTSCSSCYELQWSDGRNASDHEGFWSDTHPNNDRGHCVFGKKNMVDYVYDRPYVWSYCNCYVKRAYICERMAAPSGSFHCFQGGYVNPNRVCDGNNDCQDGSDELNCPSQCSFFHRGVNGNLGTFTYQNAQTCTWAIETPLGTNAYVEFQNFRSEFVADYATVYAGSLDPTRAVRIARLSGNQGTQTFRSFNNLMIIVFTTDAQITDSGFTGTWGSLSVSTGHVVELQATNSPQTYRLDTFDVSGTPAFLGQKDYIIVIKASNRYQIGQMITVEVDAFSIHDTDVLMVFDGDSASSKLIATLCNDCENYFVVYSTGNDISLLLRTGIEVSKPVNLRISYRQGCYFETQASFGTIFTPGYHGENIDYPNYVTCTWKINVDRPIALKFSDDADLIDTGYNRDNNADFLQIFDNGNALHTGSGFSTVDIRAQTIVATSGTVELQLTSSPTRSARGFLASWSTECTNPTFDGNTIMSTNTAVFYYTSTMTLTCSTGYSFYQEQIPDNLRSGPVTVECGFGGKWANYLEIPRCTPNYCGDVPDVQNAYILSSTGVTFGSTATYACFDGSTLNGPAQIQCQSSGLWSARPTCVAANCPANQISTLISNGAGNRVFGDGTEIGTIYRYSCNSGYQMVGSPTIFCQDNGVWFPSTTEPSCTRLRCLLKPIANGFYGFPNSAGDFINFEQTASVNCDSGYTLADQLLNSVTCYANRTTEPLPQCVNLNECNNSPCFGGDCTDNIGSYTCSCPDGYYLDNDGQTCRDVHECNQNIDFCDDACTNTIGGYECSCSLPYVLYSQPGTSGLMIPQGETGLLPSDTYHINHTCVLIQCPDPTPVQNAVLLTQRSNHLYGDHIEYQCNLGYTPLRSVLNCNSFGDWSGTVPTCQVAQCGDDRPFSLLNPPTYSPGPYNYLARLNMSCSQAGGAITFTNYRFCTYDRFTDTYELQGTGHECGVVDCGPPVGTSANPGITTFGSSFTFTCASGSRTGQSTEFDNIVRCQQDGTWGYGNLQCIGDSCNDPGYPLGGSLSATSLADGSTVTFSCDRPGYNIQGLTSITCSGQTFNGQVPTCVDTVDPVFQNCPTAPIIVKKYERLGPYLPSITATDNTGIMTFTIFPPNAETTLYVESDMTVQYVATDFASNTMTCSFNVFVYDEEPPILTCPQLEFLTLGGENEEKTFSLNQGLFNVGDNSGITPSLDIPTLPQTVFGPRDLYKTFVYTATARDDNNNVATCRSQLFVRPASCSYLSFPTPLNSVKACSTILNGNLQCVITCDDLYTFENSKSITIECVNGAWPNWIPACIRDVTRPQLDCPSPIVQTFGGTTVSDISFTFSDYIGSAIYSDINTLGTPAFTPSSLTLTTSHIYQARTIQMSVSDVAGNIATCPFQVIVEPEECHPLSYPDPDFGTKSCTAAAFNAGYTCEINCNPGYLIRNVGQSTTVACTHVGGPWAPSDRITACILDTTPPTMQCPPSRTEYIKDGNSVLTIDFETNGNYQPTVTDTGGVGQIVYQTPSIQVTVNNLNQRLGPFQISASDLRGNAASCTYYVTVLAETCSPLALPSLANGNKVCVETGGGTGYECTFTCNNGFVIPSTGLTSITTSCSNNQGFNTVVTGCADTNQAIDQIFRGSMFFRYLPTDGTTTVPNECTTVYAANVPFTRYSTMSTRLSNFCKNVFTDLVDLVLAFDSSQTTAEISTSNQNSNNLITLTYVYTMSSSNASNYLKCYEAIRDNLNIFENLAFEQDVVGNSVNCPEIGFVDGNLGINVGQSSCQAPYYQTNDNCLPCPAGTESNGIVCTQCPTNTYWNSGSNGGCISCGAGFTTRYQGAVSSGECIAECSNGQISSTGYAPCYSCPKGSYWLSSTVCQPCPNGQTTANDGTTSSSGCSNVFTVTEPCPQGTEPDQAGGCTLCSVGTYGVLSNSNGICVNCPSGSTYIQGALQSSQCYETCGSGLKSSNGLAPCVACPRGSYSVNSTYCQSCNSGLTTVGTGATSSSACVTELSLRLRCSRGTARDINTGVCEKCPIGTWNNVEDGVCQDCPPNQSTYFVGATAESMCFLKCPPGFSSSTGLSPCTPCGLNFYSETYGSLSCTQCGSGTKTVTPTAGSSAECISACPAGSFSFSGYNENGQCRLCPLNYYQTNTQSSQCSQCTPNSQYSTQQGLTSSTQCNDASVLCTNYCQNGGVCSIQNNEPVCNCVAGYEGDTCNSQVNHCLSSPCYNGGICSQVLNGFSCNCRGNANGNRCEDLIELCDVSEATPTCQNGGHCLNKPGITECLCAPGFSGATCDDTTAICQTKPCNNAGALSCEDVSHGQNLRRKCICRPGYGGVDCEVNLDDCASTPCINGGNCEDLINAFQCRCPPGYGGTFCEIRFSTCTGKSCGLDNLAQCYDVHAEDEPYCSCSHGYAHGAYAEYDISQGTAPDDITNNQNGIQRTVDECRELCTSEGGNCNRFTYRTSTGICYLHSSFVVFNTIPLNGYNFFTKTVRNPEGDFWTMRYNTDSPVGSDLSDRELLNNLNALGLNICGGTKPLDTICCRVGEMCPNILNNPSSCITTGSNPGVSSNNGIDYDVQFKCSANNVFLDNVCTQKNDYCNMNPCMNNGACSNVFGGYQCNCAPGYSGKNCQTDNDECQFSPCANVGTCNDGVNSYTCDCADGFQGTNCNSIINYCSNPTQQTCSNHGQCGNEIGIGYKCDCFSGYEGTNCEVEINYCRSEPCQHGGICQPSLNGFSCDCVPGWRGTYCELFVEECSNINTGRQCQAECHNLFDDYYCECPVNTYGENCENRPNPCRDYSKCLNNAQCLYDTATSDMSCNCLTKYMGEGCHILRDLCGSNGANNPCENGGTCSLTATDYTCDCLPGFRGTDCETEINECDNVNCPGGGTCFDDINQYYCRCPLKMTGTNCAREFDRNYDLYFNHPEGMAFAWIPYFIQVDNPMEAAVVMWTRYARNDDTGIFLTKFIGDRITGSRRFMEFDEQGVTVYGTDSNMNLNLVHLLYDRDAKLNDGNWHHIVLNMDFSTGTIRLYLDTVFHDEMTNALLINSPSDTYRMWVVLGCEFDSFEQNCVGGTDSFRGYISQVNWYTRVLTFNGSPGDISFNFANPQYIFENTNSQTPLANVAIVWNEYELESGVTRIIPSEAHGERCAMELRTPACSYFASSTMPVVNNCPNDIYIYSENRVTTVPWTEPTFSNLGDNGRVEPPPVNRPGSLYAWGIYDVTYVGIDGNNNKAFCYFRIYVNRASQCSEPVNPFGGDQTCSVQSPPVIPDTRKGCGIYCYNSSPEQYMIDRKHPELYTCGRSGSWNLANQFRQYRYPSCGLVKPDPRMSVFIRVDYKIDTSACNAVKTNMNARLQEEFARLRLIYATLCSQTDCSDIQDDIEIFCIVSGKRRKRQSTSAETVVTITLSDVLATTILDTETVSIVEFLRYFIVGDDILNFSDTIANAVIDPLNVFIEATPICPSGEVLMEGSCVECGPGNYYIVRDGVAICDDCPLGTYQTQYGQTGCTDCSGQQTTEMTGSYESTACKTSCNVGYFYNHTANGCSPCAIGYYQDESGQFYCKFCGAGYTTESTGTTTSTKCSASCDSGQQLNSDGQCVPCVIGTYRNASETRTCVSCQPGFITLNNGATSRSLCTIVACEPGNYRNQTLNVCVPCPLNQYQDENYQTQCKSCGDQSRYFTTSTGSSRQDQCLFYCPSGFEVGNNDACDICERDHYKDNSINKLSTCTLCPDNKRALVEGASSDNLCVIYKCPVGYEPNTAQNDCVECQLGYFQNIAESESCKQCLTGESTRQTASNASTDCETYCPDGQEKIGSGCSICEKGSYKDNDDGLFSACTDCNPEYTTLTTGSTHVNDCSIRTCQPGYKRNGDDSGCDPCPVGTYQPLEFQTECFECGTGRSTRQEASTDFSQCEVFCPSGEEKVNDVCTNCLRGYFKDNEEHGNFSSCELCPLEKITLTTGSTSLAECNIGNCSAGYFLRDSDKLCEECPKGEYQNQMWQESCISCGIDKTTENKGADDFSDCILECRPGYEDKNIGGCQQCQRGYFKDVFAATTCKECPIGFTTDITGATSNTSCVIPACTIGQYLDRSNAANLMCRPCDYDTYQDEIWQDQCKTCPNNDVTLQTGTTTQDLCVANCDSGQQYNFGTEECELCEIGYYRDSLNRLQTNCQICNIDYITLNQGSTSQAACNIANCTTPGTFRDVGTNTCQLCDFGSYQNQKWQTNCIGCASGESTKFQGSDSATDCKKVCPLGQYVDNTNICQLCERGYYRSDPATDECTQCPSRLLTVGPGADSIDDCNISPCTIGQYYTIGQLTCYPCDIGFYQDVAGTFQCKECEGDIKFTPTTGSTSREDCSSLCEAGEEYNEVTGLCEKCKVGTYQPLARQFTCIQCPTDQQYTDRTGSTNSNECMSFCAANANPVCSPNARCTQTNGNTDYRCDCFTNHEDTSLSTEKAGTRCTHMCDNGYCHNSAQCIREPAVSCSCSEWYEGDRCQTRVDAQDLSGDTMDIVIPVSIAAGGLLLLIILIVVFCLCWRSAHKGAKPKPQYSEFQGDRIDKASLYSYNYGQMPYNAGPPSRLMLAPYSEMVYDNNAYKAESAVYQA